MDKATGQIRHTKDLDIQGRLESMYEEVNGLVEELSKSSGHDDGESE